MEFSIKNIKNNSKLAFSGIKAEVNSQNKQVFRFIAPPHKQEEKVFLEYTPLILDKKTNEFQNPSPKDMEDNSIEFSYDIIDIPQEDIEEGFAYRYKILDKNNNFLRYEIDESKTIEMLNGSKANVISKGSNYGVTPKMGSMYHIYKDSYAIVDETTKTKLLDTTGSDFVRNHFNKLGGSVKGITYLLKNTDELDSYRYVMSTPDIGVDETSSSGYWPNNLYQCSDADDFKELNFELFKKGKGYIADGAFTSQNMQSPLFQHVLKWGEESPFYNMLKINGYIGLGILPDNSTQNVGVKLINNPLSEEYDRNKPTLLQFFDVRLTSEELKNSPKIIKTYDKESEDNYEIISSYDSISPYYFEINPKDDRIGKIFGSTTNFAMYDKIMEEDPAFFNFDNFKVTTKDNASGVAFWSGNKNIIKLNLSNPRVGDEANEDGTYYAREYLYGVATYWSEKIQSHLILETAKLNDVDLKNVAKNNDISDEDFEKIKQNVKDVNYGKIENPKTIKDYIKSFPLQSIETSPELNAIFAQPQFNEEFFDIKTTDEIEKVVNDVIDNSIPKEYKTNNDYREFVIKTFANDIIRSLIISAMDTNAIKSDGTVDKEKLSQVTLNSLEKSYPSSVDEERRLVSDSLKKGLETSDVSALQINMQKELADIKLENFKMAYSVVQQGKGGLNWRFDAARDIGDMDAIVNGTKTFYEIWDGDYGVEEFWTNFIANVKEYNPSAYIISEITDFWGYNTDDRSNLDPRIAQVNEARYNFADTDGLVPYERRIPRLKEARFLENSGSTTSSNYEACFNNLSYFIGVSPEKRDEIKPALTGNLEGLSRNVKQFVTTNQPNIALLSHTFVDNHDKPRVLHCIPLDMNLYLTKNINEVPKYYERTTELTGRKDYENICSKAIAVADIFDKQIQKSNYTQEEKNKLRVSLRNLINGKKDNDSAPNYMRALAFATRPYEVTIRDMFKNSGIKYNQEDLDNFHFGILNNAMRGQILLWEMMNAITGVPTTYNGTEFAQTGYETPSKNKYVGNRGIIRHELKDNPLYQSYYNKMQAISSLYQKSGLSAIRDGFPEFMKIINENKIDNQEALNYFVSQIGQNGGYEAFLSSIPDDIKTDDNKLVYNSEKVGKWLEDKYKINSDNGNWETFIKYYNDGSIHKMFSKDANISLWPIFKYDEKGSKVINIITNNGLLGSQLSNKNDFKTKTYSYDSIPLENEQKICPLEDGTTLRRMFYDESKAEYIEDSKEYTISDGAIKSKDGSPVEITDIVETFYVPTKAQIQAKYHTFN